MMNKKAAFIFSAALILLTGCGDTPVDDTDHPMPSMTSLPKVSYISTEPTSPPQTTEYSRTSELSSAPDMTGTELATTFIDEYGNIYGFTYEDITTQTVPSVSESSLPDIPISDYYNNVTSSQPAQTEAATASQDNFVPAVTQPAAPVTSAVPRTVTSQTTTGLTRQPWIMYPSNQSSAARDTQSSAPSELVITESDYDTAPAIITETAPPDTTSDLPDISSSANLSEKQIAEINERRVNEQNASVSSICAGKNVVMHPYSYNSLSENERYAYDVIVNAMNSYESEVYFPISKKITFDDLYNAYQCVYTDEVGLFYIDTLMEYITDQSTGYVKNMRLCYTYTESQVTRMKSEVDEAARAVLSGVTADMSEYDIVKLIHDSIIKSCTYTTTGNDITSIYGALASGNAQCQGYTRAFSYLCAKCGIETDIVLGVAAEEHMWNMVKIDGDWYHIDLTWDDPDKKQYPDSVRYDYFCLTTKRISELRTISGNSHVLPEAVSDKCDYYLKNDLIANNIEDAKNIIMKEAYTVSQTKASTIQFRCADSNVYEEVSQILFGSTSDNAISVLAEANELAVNKFYTDSIYHNSNRNTFTIKLFIDYI